MIWRRQEISLTRALGRSPAVVLLGPRQIGKTTLARQIADRTPGSIYLDLERQADARRLDDADAFLRSHLGRLVVLDEVHRAPHPFEILRSVIDEGRRQGHRHSQFLLLGSASPPPPHGRCIRKPGRTHGNCRSGTDRPDRSRPN